MQRMPCGASKATFLSSFVGLPAGASAPRKSLPVDGSVKRICVPSLSGTAA